VFEFRSGIDNRLSAIAEILLSVSALMASVRIVLHRIGIEDA